MPNWSLYVVCHHVIYYTLGVYRRRKNKFAPVASARPPRSVCCDLIVYILSRADIPPTVSLLSPLSPRPALTIPHLTLDSIHLSRHERSRNDTADGRYGWSRESDAGNE